MIEAALIETRGKVSGPYGAARELRRGTVGRIPSRRKSRTMPCCSICGPICAGPCLPCATLKKVRQFFERISVIP
jgi:hypothetical protein